MQGGVSMLQSYFEDMMAPITDGAALLQKLHESGTGEGKIEACLPVLAVAQSDGRRATADEVIKAMEFALVNPATIAKARHLAEFGTLPPQGMSNGNLAAALTAYAQPGTDASVLPDPNPAADAEGRKGQVPARQQQVEDDFETLPSTHPVTGGNPPVTVPELIARTGIEVKAADKPGDKSEGKKK